MHIDSEVSPVCAKLYTATSFPTDALSRSDFYPVKFFFFSFVRLISFSVRLAEFKQWPSGQMGDEFYPHISVAKACGSP